LLNDKDKKHLIATASRRTPPVLIQ